MMAGKFGLLFWSSGLFLLISSGLLDAKKLRFHIGTWNVGETNPHGGLEELAGVSASSSLPDVIVLGLQEITMRPGKAIINNLFSDIWTREMNYELKQWGFVKLKTVRLVGLLLNVFVHSDHEPHVTMVEHYKVPTGFGGFYGNKGGVMLSMNIYDTRIRFINSHLPAHDGHREDRVRDYKTISNGIKDEEPAELIFWMGDLNFRLIDNSLSPDAIRKRIEKGDLESLLALDELQNVISTSEGFTEYIEQPISFKPTFKLIPNTDEYNMKRRPAWTDRILFTQSDKIEALSYKSLENIKQSDHRPVVGEFIVDV